ncbi:MAG TPA: hypothetical protein PK867_27360 [Pirellulales bacterium]|nr:hypothetical protein [Pirellulales bacterium]
MTDREATAYHEAGHGIAALALGVMLDELTIDGGHGWLGRCYHRRCTSEQQGIIIAAGPIAEQRYNGKVPVDTWRGDFRRLTQYSKQVAGPSASAQAKVISGWQRRAREILDATWPEVETFARLLARHGKVDFRHLHKAPEPHVSHRRPVHRPAMFFRLKRR